MLSVFIFTYNTDGNMILMTNTMLKFSRKLPVQFREII
jgi:hypothetical protein